MPPCILNCLFLPEGDATRLIHREMVSARRFLKVFEPIMGRVLSRQLSKRLETIKDILESGWAVQV
jgi:hypothetical protein